MEISSIQSPKDEINDCFMICAVHCVDETTANPFYIGGAAGCKPIVPNSDNQEFLQPHDSIKSPRGRNTQSIYDGKILRQSYNGLGSDR
jgi:hypothetical protein